MRDLRFCAVLFPVRSLRSEFGTVVSLASFQHLQPYAGAPLHDEITSAVHRTLRTERIGAHHVTSETVRQFFATRHWSPVAQRARHSVLDFFFFHTTAELASPGIECRAPASGRLRDPLVLLKP